jgi:hypothetical protein
VSVKSVEFVSGLMRIARIVGKNFFNSSYKYIDETAKAVTEGLLGPQPKAVLGT